MNLKQHFGDSYDIVKKSLISWLMPFGNWAVHPMFTGEKPTDAEVAEFACFLNAKPVSSEVLTTQTDRKKYFEQCRGVGNLFLDPDTGVRLLDQGRSEKHIFGEELVKLVRARPKALTLIFDQSYSRAEERDSAIKEKLKFFGERQLHGFAYNSHSTFLLLCYDSELLECACRDLLKASGLPEKRIVRKQR